MTNEDLGAITEGKLIETLSSKGYWVHFLNRSRSGGQPCDLIASKYGKAIWIDVKHCKGNRFPFSRVEDNQRGCFSLARSSGAVRQCWIAIYHNQSWSWLCYDDLEIMEEEGMKSIDVEKDFYIRSFEEVEAEAF